jgi:ASC-1-like (ASCH) protein
MNHLAIMRNPYLRMIIDGKKTIESRFTVNKIAPFHKVSKGDVIYFKQSGKQDIVLAATVTKAEYYEGAIAFETLRKYQSEIGIDEEYIQKKSKAKYLSLFWLEYVRWVKCIHFVKHDQRTWLTNFREPDSSITLIEPELTLVGSSFAKEDEKTYTKEDEII